ncbi:unnamed protein product, partial [Rotaria sordida]
DIIYYVKQHFQSIFNGIRDLKLSITNIDQPKVDKERRATATSESRSHSEFVVITQQDIIQVMSDDGECMPLHRSLPLQKSVEQWLSRLQESVAETIRTDIASCIKDLDNGLPYEELISKYT